MQLAGRFDYFADPGITKLNHFTSFYIDQMIMLGTLKSSFELSYILSKLVLNNKITVQKQFDCII
jgi:hypothetical protein